MHSDELRLAKGEAYPVFKEHFGDKRKRFYFGELPPSLSEGIESVTTAQLMRLKVSQAGEKPKRETRLAPGSVFVGAIVDNGAVTVSNIGARLFVYRYADLDSLISSALKSGEISRTDQTYERQPIYRYSYKDTKDRELEDFLYATPTQELLVAEKLSHIRAMIDAGLGVELNLLDEGAYIDLIEMAPDLGQRWQLDYFKTHFMRLIETMEEKGEAESKIAKARETFERGMHYRLDSWEVGEEIVERIILKFGDEETAKTCPDSHSYIQSTSATTEFSKSPTTKSMLDSNYIVQVITYDSELLEELQHEAQKARELKEQDKE